MNNLWVRLSRGSALILGVFIVCLSAGFVLESSPYAACRCETSPSVGSTTTTGMWHSYDDGGPLCSTVGSYREGASCNPYKEGFIETSFCIPTVGELLSNIVRLFFFIAGIFAVLMLLFGGFEWLSSGGDEKKIQVARTRILSAVVGLVVMVSVMTLIVLIEQIIFGGKVCLGISCPLNMSEVIITGDKSSYTGRPPCSQTYGSNPSATGSASIAGVASPSGNFDNIVISPTPSSIATPTAKKRILILTATPDPSVITSTPTPILDSRSLVVPYGSVPSATPIKSSLPGTGGGGGGPLSPVSPL